MGTAHNKLNRSTVPRPDVPESRDSRRHCGVLSSDVDILGLPRRLCRRHRAQVGRAVLLQRQRAQFLVRLYHGGGELLDWLMALSRSSGSAMSVARLTSMMVA